MLRSNRHSQQHAGSYDRSVTSNANKHKLQCSAGSCLKCNRNSVSIILLTFFLALFGTRHSRYLNNTLVVFDASSTTNKNDKMALNSTTTNSHPRIRQIGAVGARSSGQQQPQQQELQERHPTVLTIPERNHTATNIMTARNSDINPRMLSFEERNTTNDHHVINNSDFEHMIDNYSNNSHPLEIPRVMFGDLKYRRVCAHVHSSILCLILRFPFDVPLQDPTVTFPRPFHSHFYRLKRAILVDGPLLEVCRNHTTKAATPTTDKNGISDDNNNNNNNNHDVRACLDALAQKQLPRPAVVVVALWTRQKARNHPQWNEQQIDGRLGMGTLYGTGSEMQQQRIHDFFHNHVVMVLGASPTPQITMCLTELFGTTSCRTDSRGYSPYVYPQYTCAANNKNMTLAGQASSRRGINQTLPPAGDISINSHKYIPTMLDNETLPGHVQHIVNTTKPLMEMIRNSDVVKKHMVARAIAAGHGNQLPLRPLSIIVDFPLAHTQTHFMITNMAEQVKYNQERMVEMIMNITTSPAAQQELAELGFILSSSAPMIVFDGLPHFFPTESGGYLHEIQHGSEQAFVAAQGYPGWRPELGSSCRGPLPPNSPLRRVNDLERQAFFQYNNNNNNGSSFPRKFYGKTWEFTNQFWWQTAKWSKKPNREDYFDCVHTSEARTALSLVYKYFLQAMIDDHYETIAAAAAAKTTDR